MTTAKKVVTTAESFLGKDGTKFWKDYGLPEGTDWRLNCRSPGFFAFMGYFQTVRSFEALFWWPEDRICSYTSDLA